MKTGHHLPGNLRDGGLARVVGLLVRATQTDKALRDLKFLRLDERELGLGRKLLSDRVGADVNAA